MLDYRKGMDGMFALRGYVIPCNGGVIEDGIVVVNGNTIEAVCRYDEYSLPEGVACIEVPGTTIMPGLIEQHCHIGNSGKPTSIDFYASNPYEEAVYMIEELEELLMAGFTGIRDVGGTVHFLKDVCKAGKVTAPRIFAAGKLLSDTGGHGDEYQKFPLAFSKTGLSGVLICDGVEECRKAARLQFREGADFLKICTTGGVMSEGDRPGHAYFSPEEIRVFVEEANNKCTYVASHAEGRQGIYAALQAGVKCIEHGTYLDDACIELMLKNEAWLVPTLSTMYLLTNMRDRLPKWTSEKVAGIYDVHCNAALRAYRAGVKIGVGTDFIYDRSMMPYGKNAMELELLHGIGIPAMDVLVAATRTGAGLMLAEDRVGTIEAGKLADILLVRGNPLEDIALLKEKENILMVILDGRIVKDETVALDRTRVSGDTGL